MENGNVFRLHETRNGSFSFFLKRSFRYENDDEKRKTKRSFFNGNRFKNCRFQNDRF